MSAEQITYRKSPLNVIDVMRFIGPAPPHKCCKTLTGSLEMCEDCDSHRLFFIDSDGNKVGADFGDTIQRDENGKLHLIRGSSDV